jgi:NAD(P)-dependent dehydrogenase (short-subunit alcohol dehydrogenase family)
LSPALPAASAAIVEAALRAGDRVVATARKPQQLDDLVTEYGDALYPLPLDVADQVLRAVDAAATRFGRIDVVVNNAGYGDLVSVEDVSLKDFKAQIDANFYGVVYVTKANPTRSGTTSVCRPRPDRGIHPMTILILGATPAWSARASSARRCAPMTSRSSRPSAVRPPMSRTLSCARSCC